ncbi:MAG TPA: hypothetical protein VKG01_14745, partial [Thermoanaerobaculia bacterium]|nr:hypothetical protein [Thermoanaerobaculia bacterium]
MGRVVSGRRLLVFILTVPAYALLAGSGGALLAACGPFADTASDAFCPLILEIFYLGITTGVTASTYDPSANVTRTQMAAFLARSVDTTLKRAGHRAVMNQLWTPQNESVLGLTSVGSFPRGL